MTQEIEKHVINIVEPSRFLLIKCIKPIIRLVKNLFIDVSWKTAFFIKTKLYPKYVNHSTENLEYLSSQYWKFERKSLQHSNFYLLKLPWKKQLLSIYLSSKRAVWYHFPWKLQIAKALIFMLPGKQQWRLQHGSPYNLSGPH